MNIKLLTQKNAVATPLLLLLIDEYGGDCLNWESEVIEEAAEDLAGSEIPEVNFDKIHALIVVNTSNRYFDEPKTFMLVTNAISGLENTPVDFQSFDPPEPVECGWSLIETALHRPDAGKTSQDMLDEDVQFLITQILRQHGLFAPPSPLDWAGTEPSMPLAENEQEITGAVWAKEREERQLIIDYILQRTNQLIRELRNLDLNQGDTSDLITRLQEAV